MAVDVAVRRCCWRHQPPTTQQGRTLNRWKGRLLHDVTARHPTLSRRVHDATSSPLSKPWPDTRRPPRYRYQLPRRTRNGSHPIDRKRRGHRPLCHGTPTTMSRLVPRPTMVATTVLRAPYCAPNRKAAPRPKGQRQQQEPHGTCGHPPGNCVRAARWQVSAGTDTDNAVKGVYVLAREGPFPAWATP